MGKSKAKSVYVFVHSANMYLSSYYVQGTSPSAVDMAEIKTEKKISCLCSLYAFLRGETDK